MPRPDTVDNPMAKSGEGCWLREQSQVAGNDRLICRLAANMTALGSDIVTGSEESDVPGGTSDENCTECRNSG